MQNNSKTFFPNQVTSISDVVTIVSDLGNQVPDKSWMLYLLEAFNSQQVPIELNLICSFNDDGKFHAIFGGVNRYEFKVKPVVNHSYLRQIIMEPTKHRVRYNLNDITTGKTDSFFLQIDDSSFDFSIVRHFTGLEWHNRVGNIPYPVRFEVEISHLSYGINDDPSDLLSLAYFPYNQLIKNQKGLAKEYPVSHHSYEIRNGYITYKIGSGEHGQDDRRVC
ncbi:MAG: hypothetical protein PXX83_08300 [Candidatus Nitrosotalea sp.]|nr:hypothetical protein [Candidatus Nitrosotalea sp.]